MNKACWPFESTSRVVCGVSVAGSSAAALKTRMNKKIANIRAEFIVVPLRFARKI
jgi:hypothetical protein